VTSPESSSIFTVTFWKDAVERSVKSTAQAAVLAIAGNDVVVDFWNLDVKQIIGVAASGAVLSLLTSLASAPFSSRGTASVTNAIVAAPELGRHSKDE